MSEPASRNKQSTVDWFAHFRAKSKSLINGGISTDNALQVGLLPNKGAIRRNYRFVRRVLLPQIFAKRSGETKRPDLAAQESSDFKVTWIGHASFLIQTEGMNVLVDPVWARWLGIVKRVREPGLAIGELPPIHLVLITHAHFDHLHIGSVTRVANGQPVITPKGVGSLMKGRGFGEIVELGYWERIMCGPLEIIFTPSKHWGARMVHDTHRGFGGYLIRNSAGRTVFHCGDSAYFNGFGEIGSTAAIDLAMMPIGAYLAMSGRQVHMNPEEAVRAFKEMRAAHMVPMHYGTFPLGGEPMDEPLRLLERAREEYGVKDRVSVLEEGRPSIF